MRGMQAIARRAGSGQIVDDGVQSRVHGMTGFRTARTRPRGEYQPAEGGCRKCKGTQMKFSRRSAPRYSFCLQICSLIAEHEHRLTQDDPSPAGCWHVCEQKIRKTAKTICNWLVFLRGLLRTRRARKRSWGATFERKWLEGD